MKKSKHISLKSFTVKDEFWNQKMELIREMVIPYQWDMLNDNIEGASPSYCIRNFEIAGKFNNKNNNLDNFRESIIHYPFFSVWPEDKDNLEDRFYGFYFQDSDLYKWLEAVSFTLATQPNEELEKIADKAIDLISEAQKENGYLSTYYIIGRMDHIFTNLRDTHELYCLGHLIEAACAYYECTSKDKLLNVAIKFADFVYDSFGFEDNKLKGQPGHQIAEMALVKLYEVTGNEKYLKLSEFFIKQRGQKPNFFDGEVRIHCDKQTDHVYQQSHLPVLEQIEAVGHAVRAVYMYSGMADIAKHNNDEELYNACKLLWKNITNENMYITGGIGSTSIGEAFTFSYDLPNDLAYAETCASIGLIFFARRMMELDLNSDYSNVVEQALYNTVLSGIALDGKSFFYVNPLEVLPEACHKDERKKHVKPVRQKWFGCACCPPNVSRLISSIPMYAYGQNDDTIFVHQYIGGTIDTKIGEEQIKIDIMSNLPWNGDIKVTIRKTSPDLNKIALRVPDWDKEFIPPSIPNKQCYLEDGYLYIVGDFINNEEFKLSYDMKPKLMISNHKVRNNLGKVCLVRGPIVYCIEGYDNGGDLHTISIDSEAEIIEEKITIEGQEFISLVAEGRKLIQEEKTLYSTYKKPQYEDIKVTFIPYFAWANRGENEMLVWVNVQ